MRRRAGFTLIEMMIVVVVIGILAAIASSRFSDLLRKSGEGSSLGNLGAIRSALSIYYGDLEGQYPENLGALTIGGKYLATLPTVAPPNYHPVSSASVPVAPTDAGGWVYNNVASAQSFGSVNVNCTHTDTKGSVWSAY